MDALQEHSSKTKTRDPKKAENGLTELILRTKNKVQGWRSTLKQEVSRGY